MSTVRFMSHEDTNAPPFYGYSRTSIYTWFNQILVDGYNLKYVNNFVREGRKLTLNFTTPHGFLKGRLLVISDSSFEPLNNVKFRVTSVPSTTSLTLFIKDEAWESYPQMSTETTMTIKVAPLGWEVLYKTNEQISFRSRRDDSSKTIITIKKPTYPYHTTGLKTTGAVAYEVDYSKDIDLTTGSPIDSYFTQRLAQYGHTCNYWVCSTNTDNLQDSASWTNETFKVPWTIIGDDKFFYFIGTPFVDGLYENGSYRVLTTQTYNGSYRAFRLYAMGDIEAADPQEYLTGSSFFFTLFYYANNNSRDALGTSHSDLYNYTPFANINGSYTRSCYFASTYDITGNIATARILSGGNGLYDSYNSSGSDYLWPAYPERVTGGVTYCKYYAYANDTGAGRNSYSVFYKGEFPFVRALLTNLRNYSSVHRGQHMVIFDLENTLTTKQLITHSWGGYNWSGLDYTGNHLFELD